MNWMQGICAIETLQGRATVVFKNMSANHFFLFFFTVSLLYILLLLARFRSPRDNMFAAWTFLLHPSSWCSRVAGELLPKALESYPHLMEFVSIMIQCCSFVLFIYLSPFPNPNIVVLQVAATYPGRSSQARLQDRFPWRNTV